MLIAKLSMNLAAYLAAAARYHSRTFQAKRVQSHARESAGGAIAR